MSGALGNGHNLTIDREFRYVVQWFTEWSDFQREDFVPVLAAYLLTHKEGEQPTTSTYINGIVGGMTNLASPGQDKPMNLFQCRVKLFNEWTSKWPEANGEKLLERLTEIDPTFGKHVRSELTGDIAQRDIDEFPPTNESLSEVGNDTSDVVCSTVSAAGCDPSIRTESVTSVNTRSIGEDHS